MKRILESIGLGHIRFHDLRHSFATISLQNSDDIKTVSENLGHATVAFTLDVYGHVTDKMKKDSADRMLIVIYLTKVRVSALLLYWEKNREKMCEEVEY